MALFQNGAEGMGERLGGLLVGVGAFVVAPLVVPALRPVAKQLIKGGLVLSDQARVWVAESAEQWSDLVAEARSEVDRGTVEVKTPQ